MTDRQAALVVGYGDLGKAVEKELFSAGYETLHVNHYNYLFVLQRRCPDIIINCCGIFEFSPISEDLILGLEKWDRIFGANVRFAWQLAKDFYDSCKNKDGWKYLVNIGSESAFITHKDSALYCMSKSALTMMTKCLAKELEKDKFAVLQIDPGMIKDTKMTSVILEKFPQSDNDFVTKEQVAKFVVHLLSLGRIIDGNCYAIGTKG